MQDLNQYVCRKTKSYMDCESLTNAYLKDLDKTDDILHHDIQLKMIEEYITGGKVDKKLRDAIFQQNVRFVIHVVKRYTSYGVTFMDLVQEGNIGLMEAIENFDVEKAKLSEATISTYAYFHIIKRVMNYIETNSNLIRFQRTNENQKLFHNYFKIEQGEMSNKEYVDTLCRELYVSKKSAEDMLAYMKCNYVSSYNMNDGEECDIFEAIEDDRFDPALIIEADLSREQETAVLTLALSQLSRDERFIIRCRWLSDEPRTLKQVGDSLNLSGERVRQIEVRALKRLKAILENNN